MEEQEPPRRDSPPGPGENPEAGAPPAARPADRPGARDDISTIDAVTALMDRMQINDLESRRVIRTIELRLNPNGIVYTLRTGAKYKFHGDPNCQQLRHQQPGESYIVDAFANGMQPCMFGVCTLNVLNPDSLPFAAEIADED